MYVVYKLIISLRLFLIAKRYEYFSEILIFYICLCWIAFMQVQRRIKKEHRRFIWIVLPLVFYMDKEKLNILRNEPIGRLLWRYFWPAFIGVMANALYNIVDRIFIGQWIGAEALSGITAVFPVMIIMMAFGMLVGIGGSVQLSIALGKQDYSKAGKVLGNTVLLVLVVSVFVTALGFLIKGPMLHWFGATDVTVGYANNYLNIILWGVIFQMYGFSLNSLIRAEGNARIAMYSMLISAGVNIPLDAFMIGVLGLGVKGAAYATIISMMILSIWVSRHFMSKRCVVSFSWKTLRPEWAIVFSILAVGLAPFFMQIANSIVQSVINSQLIAYGGDIAVGAMGIIMSVTVLVIMTIVALNMASQPIIGYAFGAKMTGRVKETVRKGMIIATVISTGSWLIIQLIPGPLIKIFNTDNQELLRFGIIGFRTYLFMLPVVGFQIIISNYFQSVGKAKIAALLSLLRQVIILLPLLFILPKEFGLRGIWLASPIADTVAAIVSGTLMYLEWKRFLNEKSLDNQ